jgi:Spy/CpxP family protein refolding chaperone
MIESPPEQKREMPVWLSVGLVAVVLLVGGAFVWWYWSDDGPSPRTVITGREVVDPQVQAQQQRRAMERRSVAVRRAAVEAPDGITERRGGWRVKSGDALMDVSRGGAREFRYRYSYVANDFGTPEDRQMGIVLWRLRNDQATAESLGITPEQMQQLQELPQEITIQMSREDRQQLAGLWEAWHSASAEEKPQLEQELRETLREVAQRSRPATERAVAERAQQIRQVLTAEQLEQFAAMGR